MRIGIDARPLYRPKLKGIGIYLKHLLAALAEIDKINKYVLFYDAGSEFVARKPLGAQFIEKGLKVKGGETFYFLEQLCFPQEIKRERIQIFHSTANTTFLWKRVPVVVTIHDTKPFENKSDFWKEEFYTKSLQPAALRKAQRIITPSLYSKKSIVEKLKIPENKIEVIYQGMGKQFKVIEDRQALGRIGLKLKLDGKFILTVGGETPSKNISRLIEAYALLKKKNVVHQLVITGIRNQDVLAKHLAEVQKLGIEGHVKILGYVDEEDLIGLYNLTDLFIYPSLFEGFGFPPLEAMACGAVVAASNATSIPEVVGDAGLLFDGKNIQNMADSMHRLIQDETLKQDLRRKGFERVKQFEWRLSAQKTLAVYKEISS